MTTIYFMNIMVWKTFGANILFKRMVFWKKKIIVSKIIQILIFFMSIFRGVKTTVSLGKLSLFLCIYRMFWINKSLIICLFFLTWSIVTPVPCLLQVASRDTTLGDFWLLATLTSNASHFIQAVSFPLPLD